MSRGRDPDAPPRICATTARARYGVRDADLARIDCDLYVNPHYRGAAPMRLYHECDVLALAELVRWERERVRVVASKAKAARAAAHRARKAALLTYAPRTDVPDRPGPGAGAGVGLPMDVLELVARALTAPARGPGQAARDLAAMAAASRELRVAARAGFAALPKARRAGARTDWAAFLRAPTSLTLPELRAAARERGRHVAGTKADVAARLLLDLNVSSAPSPAAALAVVAVADEKRGRPAAFDA